MRATCHGVSAACGKLGAAVGAYAFPFVLTGRGPSSGGSSNEGLKTCMLLCSVVAFMGAFVTYLFTPRYGGLDLLVGEDNYLELVGICRMSDAKRVF